MNPTNTAISLAEGDPEFKMDVSLVFGGEEPRKHVLRTCLDRYGVWKSKYVHANASLFEVNFGTQTKDAAEIGDEIWIFGIDSTSPNDIVTAVKIAAQRQKIEPRTLMRNIYVKNLNAENEHTMMKQALVRANKNLYTKVCDSIREAAKVIGVTGEINFWVMSSNINHKIPKEDLHNALRDGGADGVAVAKKKYRFMSGGNDGEDEQYLITNLHLARFNI